MPVEGRQLPESSKDQARRGGGSHPWPKPPFDSGLWLYEVRTGGPVAMRRENRNATMAAQQLSIIIDTREQQPWTFAAEVARGEAEVSTKCLTVGDYSLAAPGMTEMVAVERKSVADLWGCCGKDRRRFRAQLERMAALRWPLVVIEGTIAEIAAHPVRGGYRRRLTAASVIGTLTGWSCELRVPWVPAGGVRAAERLAFIHLRHAQRLRARELGRVGHD